MDLDRSDDRAHLESIAQRLTDFRAPTPSGVALSLMRLAGREDVEIAEASAVLKRDPTLTSKIIRLANSPLYAGRRTVIAVEEAVIRVGLGSLSRLAISLSLLSVTDSPCSGFDVTAFWTRSLAMALSAQYLSQRVGSFSPSEMFSIGLLVEFGRLAMAGAFPDLYAEMTKRLVDSQDATLLKAELDTFGFNHQMASAAMLHSWGFPSLFVRAMIGGPEEQQVGKTENQRTAQISAIITLSRRIALLAENHKLRAPLNEAVDLATSLKLTKEDLLQVLSLVADQWPSWCQLLDLKADQDEIVHKLTKLREELLSQHIDPVKTPEIDIVLITDDRQVSDTVTKALKNETGRLLKVKDLDSIAKDIRIRPAIALVDAPDDNPQLGIQRSQELRIAFGSRLYIILLGGDEIEVNALQKGVDNVLPKPIEPSLLASRVRVALRVATQLRQLELDKERSERVREQLTELSKDLRQEAMIDPLTELPNRRYALEFLNNSWGVSVRQGTPLCCIVADLDHFKKINDNHGHDVGDRILRVVSNLLRIKTRPGDAVCRYGGEEFLIICPNTNLEACAGLAARLRDSLESHVGDHPPVTISLGLAERRTEDMTVPADLVRAADRALLKAKRSGRNGVAIDMIEN